MIWDTRTQNALNNLLEFHNLTGEPQISNLTEITCAQLRRGRGMGRKGIMKVLTAAHEGGVRLKCGCPTSPPEYLYAQSSCVSAPRSHTFSPKSIFAVLCSLQWIGVLPCGRGMRLFKPPKRARPRPLSIRDTLHAWTRSTIARRNPSARSRITPADARARRKRCAKAKRSCGRSRRMA